MEGSERRVAVVGGDDRAAGLRETVQETDGNLVDPAEAGEEDETGTSVDVDAVIAVGDDAIRESLIDGSNAPVIPVGRRRLALDLDDATRHVRRILDAPATRGDGDGDDVGPFDRDSSYPLNGDSSGPLDGGIRRVTHPILAVDTGTGPVRRAAFDVALVTEEPARISEFAVGFPNGHDESFRADGVVAATALGSDGYANAAGGPLVEPGGGFAVVPIAPFSTRTDAWVAGERTTISIEREDEPVALVIDGTKAEIVDPYRPFKIETVDRTEVIVRAATAASRTPGYERDDRKHSNKS